MTMFQVRIYHNTQSRFEPYQDGHRLDATVSHCLYFKPDTRFEDIADWAFHVCNADLDQLEPGRTSEKGEISFLVACAYRLLGFRSLSVGDVVEVSAGPETRWLACDSYGWRHVTRPAELSGASLTAERVYAHLERQRGNR